MTRFRLPPRVITDSRDSIDRFLPRTLGAIEVPRTPVNAAAAGVRVLAEFDFEYANELADPSVSMRQLVRLDNWMHLAERLDDAEIRMAVASWMRPRACVTPRVTHDLGNGYFVVLLEESLTQNEENL